MKIDISLFVIGIILVIVGSFYTTNTYHRNRFRRRYEIMKNKFITYLNDLDNENDTLSKQLGKKDRNKRDFSNIS